MELNLGTPKSDNDSRVSGNKGSEKVRGGAGVGEMMELRAGTEETQDVVEIESDGDDDGTDMFEARSVGSDDQDDGVEVHNRQFGALSGVKHSIRRSKKVVEVENHIVPQFNTLLTEFDDYVANEKNVVMAAGTSNGLEYGFEVGDMVWGKVKSHPWWPGQLFNEAFAFSSSARRMRRNDHVLVAFYGDSSFGWFDPAELIPFDPNFTEKSVQMNSKNFVKAVEEAVDEGNRRCGLALSCKCRNPYNFRPMKVPGYYAVDVPDYEPAAIYSASQINKARDSFRPGETLSFIKQLALKPQESEQISIGFIKNKATVFAYRKAVFEEFDETYAQAFGVATPHPSHNRVDQPVKEPPRAPLSGPLVIAEPLGGKKSSKKTVKFKEHSNKDKYLLKRREEPHDLKVHQISKRKASSLDPEAYTEELAALATGDYLLHKRPPGQYAKTEIPADDEQLVSTSLDSVKESIIVDHTPDYSIAAVDVKLSHVKEADTLQESNSDSVSKEVSPSVTDDVLQSFERDGKSMFDHVEDEKIARPFEIFRQHAPNLSMNEQGTYGLDQAQGGLSGAHPSPMHFKHPSVDKGDVMVKAKVLKRPLKDLGSENSISGEKRKKKIKREGTSLVSSNQNKHMIIEKKVALAAKLAGKSSQVSYASNDDNQLGGLKKVDSTSNYYSDRMSGSGNVDLELPQLLSDLQSLALNPYYGSEQSIPATVKKFFLRFRSLVYQKSLVLSPPSSVQVGDSGNHSDEIVRDMPSKPLKAFVRPVDPTKTGRKHLQSDRQEEIAAKRLKKISDLKSLAAEKKASMKTQAALRDEGRGTVTPVPPKSVKPVARKVDPAAKAVDPTMLVMKFPPETSLPSITELKARFARFGQLDYNATRVFWKSSTCRVVFQHKSDAQAALKYAVGNNSLFGNLSVRYSLREVGAPEGFESGNLRSEDTPNDSSRIKDPSVLQPPSAFTHQLPIQQPAVQLKSILKKPPVDDTMQVSGNGNRGNPRVKFVLGEEETSREQLNVGNRNNFNNNASFGDAGLASIAMDFNSSNIQKVMSPSPLPILPLPKKVVTQHNKPQHAEVPERHTQNIPKPHHAEVPERRTQNIPKPQHADVPEKRTLNIPKPQHAEVPDRRTQNIPTVDISQKMLSLLTRCNDVVNNVTRMLGHVPYHAL